MNIELIKLRNEFFTRGLATVVNINNLPLAIKKKLYKNIIKIQSASANNEEKVLIDMIDINDLLPFLSVGDLLSIQLILTGEIE